jgi:hypothetical protein|tara:strand:+ start:941 stop:1171 length:231 start_codon:yes stop_codon:yes gene_type:complete
MTIFSIELDSDHIAKLLHDDQIAADDISHFTQMVIQSLQVKQIDAYGRAGDSVLDKAIKNAISIVIDCAESSVFDT